MTVHWYQIICIFRTYMSVEFETGTYTSASSISKQNGWKQSGRGINRFWHSREYNANVRDQSGILKFDPWITPRSPVYHSSHCQPTARRMPPQAHGTVSCLVQLSSIYLTMSSLHLCFFVFLDFECPLTVSTQSLALSIYHLWRGPDVLPMSTFSSWCN